MNERKQLAELHRRFAEEDIPFNLIEIVEAATGVRLAAKYVDLPLRNPVLVGPGQITLNLTQVKMIRDAGYGNCVLKSIVGEEPDNSCTMSMQRLKPTSIKTFYESDDKAGEFPIIHWNGRCDVRSLRDYLKFAVDVKSHAASDGFTPVASILCHLPMPGEAFREDEWIHTTKAIYDAGYTHIEIDFCPFLKRDNFLDDQQNVLRWYRTCPGLMKSVSSEIRVVPKALNLEWGFDFQMAIAKAAAEGGSDGLSVANRMFRAEYGSGHGGTELRQRNLAQVREIKRRFPSLSISATGGVYCGRQVYEYLQAGADNIQLVSYIMGKVKKPFARKRGNKFEQVFHKIILDPADGLVASMLNDRVFDIREVL